MLILLGADPIGDFPDARLAKEALMMVPTVIAVDAFLSPSIDRADVFLPCTLPGEKAGTATNLEGRVQRLGRKVAPEGTAMDDWRIAIELAARLGHEIDLATVDEVTDALGEVAPAFAGVSAALMQRARDGVVLPLREHRDELVLRARDLSIMADDGPGTSWDPIKVEGIVPADSTSAVEGSGAGFEPIAPGGGDPNDDPETAAWVVEAATQAADAAAAPDVPSLHVWDAMPPGTDTPGRDAYALRLVAGRTLYDRSRVVIETPVLARLTPAAGVLRVHPNDTGRIGAEQGSEVRITTGRGSQLVTLEPDASVPPGTARFDFTADGQGPALLIDAASPVTDLRVESIR